MSRLRFIALLLVLITLVAYMPVVRNGFSCYDDYDYVTNNSVVQGGLTWAGIRWAFTTWQAANWHPLTWLSHMLDCQLFGLNSGAQHYVNVLFHAANAVLLLWWLFRLTGALWSSAFVAALFAWHPLHVQTVAWISERKDVLSTSFALLSLLSYTRFVRQAQTPAGRRPSVSADYWLAVICFAFGLLAKPMVVTLPFVMLLLDYWPFQRFSPQKTRPVPQPISQFQFSGFLHLTAEKWPFFLLSAASCVVTLFAQHNAGAVMSLVRVPLSYRLENIPVAYAGYLLKMFWPAHLAVYYPLQSLSAQTVAAATAALTAISWLAWRLRRQHAYGWVGWLWFLGTLVPVIGLVQVGGAAMADRYTYFPSIGIFLAATLGLRDLAKRFNLSEPRVAAAAGLTLLACLILMENQLRYWRSDVALFSHAITVTRNNDIAYLNLGYALQIEGRKIEAVNAVRESLRINPSRDDAHDDLANLLSETGRPDEALAEYGEALRLNPNNVAAHENFGIVLAQLGRSDDALEQFATAARLDPNGWHAYYMTGKTLLRQGRDAEGVSYLHQALKLDPDNLEVLTFLAGVLASAENPNVRDGHTAFLLASRANTLTDGTQPAMLDLLAMASAELGRFDDAVKTEEDALTIAKANGLTNDAAVIQKRLQLYQQHQPFRQTFQHLSTKESFQY